MATFNKDGTISFVAGKAQLRYKIQSPKVNLTTDVECNVKNPVNWIGNSKIDLNTMKIISGNGFNDYVEPPTVPAPGEKKFTVTSIVVNRTITWTISSSDTTSTESMEFYAQDHSWAPNHTSAAAVREIMFGNTKYTVKLVNGVGTIVHTFIVPSDLVTQLDMVTLTSTTHPDVTSKVAFTPISLN